ncbi:DUF4381 domain-containing protein [Litorilituus lipolyticus]|uniref:DUF4381 domain-containing protein n=1 Tax=Litorilituus lipolyticus TaxID=2491017 RepID=A0A502LCU5_9GAMM|nr:DUF4381 domain-containing protein [Litorilituus lipolyticus]TPH17937.1 DUF4381 domain-containing protein [Litorilituus lipolyticus]
MKSFISIRSILLSLVFSFSTQVPLVLANTPQQLPAAGQPSASPLQLNDIHLPEKVSQLPISYGWWLLLLLIAIAIYFSVRKFKQHKQRNKYKNQAIKLLSTSMNSEEVITLLKWAALQYFPRAQLSKLYGEQFQQFLMEQLPKKHQQQFSALTSDSFSIQYQQHSNAPNEQCYQAAKLWLAQALPPKVKVVKGGIDD